MATVDEAIAELAELGHDRLVVELLMNTERLDDEAMALLVVICRRMAVSAAAGTS